MIRCSNPEKFFELQKQFEKIPFTQTEAWYNYLAAQGKKLEFFAENPDNPVIIFWGIAEKIPVSGKKLLRVEGECCKNYGDERVRTFFELLKKEDYAGIEFNSNTEYHIDFEINLRRSGFVRPIGFFSCPLTIEVELQKKPEYNRNWKRNVSLAEKKGLHFLELNNPGDVQIDEIVTLFSQMAELKSLGYRLSKVPVSRLTQSDGVRTFAVLDENLGALAIRIIHVRKKWGADMIAANADASRTCGATFFLMQRIFETLRDEGVEYFDFGRIAPSDSASDNVYLFKNASRGRKIQYNGEWVYYRNKISELAVFIYKWLKIKKQRY